MAETPPKWKEALQNLLYLVSSTEKHFLIVRATTFWRTVELSFNSA